LFWQPLYFDVTRKTYLMLCGVSFLVYYILPFQRNNKNEVAVRAT
jgi:hypothetical protein